MHGDSPIKKRRKAKDSTVHAVDLTQAEFFNGTYTLVDKFMVCRAKHPEHVTLVPFHRSPSSIPFVVWFVGSFKNTTLAAFNGLANPRKVGISLVESSYQRVFAVFIISSFIVSLHRTGIGFIKSLNRASLTNSRTLRRAMLGIRSHLFGDTKLGAALSTVSFSIQVVVWMFATAFVPSLGSAFVLAIFRAILCRLKRCITVTAGLQIHSSILPRKPCVYGGLAVPLKTAKALCSALLR